MNDIPLHREELEVAFKKKEKFKYLFFWGHTPKDKKTIDKTCFSQWFPSVFEIDGVSYKTAEHYMMAEKARLFNDQENLIKVLEAGHPKQAKSFGRLVKNFDPRAWDDHKFEAVWQANYAKFCQNDELKKFLLNTGKKVLVEASPVDKIWGIGMAQDDANANNPLKWKGENLLGFALMKVREQLAE